MNVRSSLPRECLFARCANDHHCGEPSGFTTDSIICTLYFAPSCRDRCLVLLLHCRREGDRQPLQNQWRQFVTSVLVIIHAVLLWCVAVVAAAAFDGLFSQIREGEELLRDKATVFLSQMVQTPRLLQRR